MQFSTVPTRGSRDTLLNSQMPHIRTSSLATPPLRTADMNSRILRPVSIALLTTEPVTTSVLPTTRAWLLSGPTLYGRSASQKFQLPPALSVRRLSSMANPPPSITHRRSSHPPPALPIRKCARARTARCRELRPTFTPLVSKSSLEHVLPAPSTASRALMDKPGSSTPQEHAKHRLRAHQYRRIGRALMGFSGEVLRTASPHARKLSLR